MRKGPWLAALAALLITPGCFLFEADPPENLLVLSVDGLRLDALGTALGAPRTPNIQRLSGSGTSFALCFTHSGATLPAQAALLSGRSPSSTRVRIDGQDVDPDVPLLQDVLRDAGWQTYGVFASPDTRASAEGRGLDRGFHLVRAAGPDAASASEVNAQALPMIERASPDSSWFAFVEYADPTAPYAAHGTADRHAQILVDGRALDSVGTSDPAPWHRTLHLSAGQHTLEVRGQEDVVARRLEARSGPDALAVTWKTGRLDAPARKLVAAFELAAEGEVELSGLVHDVPDVQELRQRYRLEVEAVDRAIGELVASLERSGQYDRTTIVVVAPHGESLGEHGEVGHGTNLYDEVLRVPLVIKPALGGKALARLAQRRLEAIRVVDVAPTLLDLVGEGTLPGAEGASLLVDAPRPLVAEVHPPQAAGTLVAMRDDRYKLIYLAAQDRFEMFDVKSDTLELDNVFPLQGHFRLKWQAQLRDLAERAPHAADQRTGRAETAAARN